MHTPDQIILSESAYISEHVISSHRTILFYHLDTKNINKVTLLGGKISL